VQKKYRLKNSGFKITKGKRAHKKITIILIKEFLGFKSNFSVSHIKHPDKSPK
jgi:hypothetical protein